VDALVRPLRIDPAFEDPRAIRRLVEQNGPYPSIATYLPRSAANDTLEADTSPDTTLPWYRGNWAVDGHAVVPGADTILKNPRFIDAATGLFDAAVVPTTVVVNVNAPMSAGAVHVDIPSFRGAGRDRYPLRLLQAMGTSGLFEHWRIVEAGAVCWFYDGPGGAYDYWPTGLDGEMCSERPPFDNVALVADNDRMYHRIGWIGERAARSPTFPASSTIAHADGAAWTITDAGHRLANYSESQVRISVLWKAQVQRDDVGEPGDALRADLVVDLFAADLARRGIDAARPTTPLSDETWINLMHATYYPAIHIDS
jgi:hypothetical protein